MDSTDETTSSVLLLDRPGPIIETGPVADEDLAVPSSDLAEHHPRRQTSTFRPTAERSGSDFRGPVLGALAAASILVGYRWLGVIPVSSSRLSSLVFGRPSALVFAFLALWLAWAAGRAQRGDTAGRRPRAARLLVVTASISTVVAVGLILSSTAALRYSFGVSELLVASVAGAFLLVDERHRRSGSNLPPATPPGPGYGATTP